MCFLIVNYIFNQCTCYPMHQSINVMSLSMHQIKQHLHNIYAVTITFIHKTFKMKKTGPRQIFEEEVGQMSGAIISAILKYRHYGRQPLPDSLISPCIRPCLNIDKNGKNLSCHCIALFS